MLISIISLIFIFANAAVLTKQLDIPKTCAAVTLTGKCPPNRDPELQRTELCVCKTPKPWWCKTPNYWSLLYSAILRSRADSLRSHVILHEWIAFYSAFLNIHRSGVLTALAWLVPVFLNLKFNFFSFFFFFSRFTMHTRRTTFRKRSENLLHRQPHAGVSTSTASHEHTNVR